MGKITKRFFREITATSAGLEINGVLGGNYSNIVNGLLKTIVIDKVSGAATTISAFQIRYESGNSDLSNLIYSATNMTFTNDATSDSFIESPFSLSKPDAFDDLIIFIQPDATGVFTIRIDLEIF